MKTKLGLVVCSLALLFLVALRAGTPEQEKAFVDKYKTAYEANDKKTLESFLYTKGANPMALEFYKMMMANDEGSKISKIELENLSPEDAKKAAAVEEGPDGKKSQLPIVPTKKLKVSVEQKGDSGSSSGSSSIFVAEKDGKFVIPVPATAK